MTWRHRGQQRPPFAIQPRADQESVWDYPRPPCLEPDRRLVEIRAGDRLIARTRAAYRVLETASPPTFYLPRTDVRMPLLRLVGGTSLCEWKGRASYYDVDAGDRLIERAAWTYEDPTAAFAEIAGCISFYPGRVDCYVDGERVRAQAGGFYGGWVTDEIVGPYKGEPDTWSW